VRWREREREREKEKERVPEEIEKIYQRNLLGLSPSNILFLSQRL
jgi:hypothetical protein